MIVSNLYLNCDDALTYEGKPPRSPVDSSQLGIGATQRIYETAHIGADTRTEPHENADPHWVCVAAPGDDTFARLCTVAGREDLAEDPRFATRRARAEHRVALEAELEQVFRTRTAQEWETSLQAAGVGCVKADAMSHFAFLYKDPQAQAIGMMVQADHPAFGGVYWRYAPVLQFSDTPSRATRYCELGEHTRTILRELGYDDDEIRGLKEAEVVTWPAEEEELAAAR